MMKIFHLIPVSLLAVLLGACTEEPPPVRSVQEFMENSILLEATMVRCAQDRSKMKYEADCRNALEAVNRFAAREEEQRKKELEAQFERKRRALRRTQEAAAEARRRAAEEQRRREEAEYLGIYEVTPGDAESQAMAAPAEAAVTATQPQQILHGNEPGAAIDPPTTDIEADSEPPTATADDIDAVREELKRRQDGAN